MNHLTNDSPAPMMLTELNKEVSNPEYEEWQHTDMLLRSWITGTLSEAALSHVVGLNTS